MFSLGWREADACLRLLRIKPGWKLSSFIFIEFPIFELIRFYFVSPINREFDGFNRFRFSFVVWKINYVLQNDQIRNFQLVYF